MICLGTLPVISSFTQFQSLMNLSTLRTLFVSLHRMTNLTLCLTPPFDPTHPLSLNPIFSRPPVRGGGVESARGPKVRGDRGWAGMSAGRGGQGSAGAKGAPNK